MNPQVLRNLGFFLIGGGVGFFAGKIAFEKQVREEYKESVASMARVMDRRLAASGHKPLATEQELEDASNTERDRLMEETEAIDGPVMVSDGHIVALAGDITRADDDDSIPNYVNPYRKSLERAQKNEVMDTSVELFVDGGVNDYGISYIEEDDYDEEDGRFKGQVTMVMGHNGNPDFFMDGVQINDWAERVGDSIIVDFYQHVPPNAPPILFVRNHKRDEDYEVIRENP